MSTTSRNLAARYSVSVKEKHAGQGCPACGGLQCLCRPRFFAGQLLTEEDLNRLDRYIVEKNKLHNRYLHGWGVVCGLEVACHPCKGYVTVRSGYALSPCGDDIIVCQDEAVNVCDLINQCKVQPEWDCDPEWPRPEPLCGDADEEWILYLCYNETPSRGVTALRGASSGGSCCSRCSGSSQCGCGCHPSTNGKSSCAQTKTPTRSTPQQCEPTLTCEGYTFQLRKAPKTDRRDLGELINRLRACLRELVLLEQELIELVNRGQLHAFQEAVMAYMEHHSIHNCELVQALLRLRMQLEPTGTATPSAGAATQALIRQFMLEMLRDCVCSAILPPCPSPAEDNCVPLATLTINCREGCQIKHICNWKHRRLVVTFPNLEYWLQFLFRQSGLSEVIAALCCGPLLRRGFDQGDSTFAATTAATTAASPNIWAAMFDEAAKGEGIVTSKSIFENLRTMMTGFISRMKGNP